ncbi:ciliary protein causing Leber congenital amaurosis disease-domain-containing protein [Blastocladiella britannica]|nr:ciliary protein causing Leber congenital amaurosis disease-domain-containing protein [Blastocladiella britannica]
MADARTQQRAKIYGQPPSADHSRSRDPARSKTPTKQDRILTDADPPPKPQSQPTAAPAVHAHAIPPTQPVPFNETALWHEHERLKGSLKERDLRILALKEEAAVLRQIERRHQRELADMESKNDDAPRIIRGLREEVSGLKLKLKDSYSFQGTQDRRIRGMADQLESARQQNAKLRELVDEHDLRVRHELQHEIESSQRETVEHQRTCAEMQHKCALLEKNLAAESLNLRMKIRTLDDENKLFKDRIQDHENTIRDRDREIASLSIYKYNALHRKPEPCTVCAKRDIAERESRRRKEILAALPHMPKPVAKIISATSILVKIKLPGLAPPGVNYDRVVVHCSIHEDFSQVRSIKLDPIACVGTKQVDVPFTDLPTGKFAYMRACAMIGDVSGEMSDHETIWVDVVPPAPPAPTVATQCSPGNAALTLGITLPSAAAGTLPKFLRVYRAIGPTDQKQSTCPPSSEFHLASQLSLMTPAPRQLSYSLPSPTVAVPYFFCLSLVNECGESQRSAIVGPFVLDFAPMRPLPPQVQRHGLNSVQVAVTLPVARGESVVARLKVVVRPATGGDERTIEVSRATFDVNGGVVIVEGLENGLEYVFAVSVANGKGFSEASGWSIPVCLDALLPVPPSPQCIILSPTTVRLLLYSAHDGAPCPPHVGYKLWVSRQHDFSDAAVLCPFIPVEVNMTSEYMAEHLDPGSNYWFAVTLLGKDQESGKSPFVWVCLAAAIPLPSTPRATTPRHSASASGVHSVVGAVTQPPPPTNLNRATSRSIGLSVSQRVHNLFRGNPAFAIPDDVRLAAERDGVTVVVTNGYTSPRAMMAARGGVRVGGGNSVESVHTSRRDLTGGDGGGADAKALSTALANAIPPGIDTGVGLHSGHHGSSSSGGGGGYGNGGGNGTSGSMHHTSSAAFGSTMKLSDYGSSGGRTSHTLGIPGSAGDKRRISMASPISGAKRTGMGGGKGRERGSRADLVGPSSRH